MIKVIQKPLSKPQERFDISDEVIIEKTPVKTQPAQEIINIETPIIIKQRDSPHISWKESKSCFNEVWTNLVGPYKFTDSNHYLTIIKECMG